MEDLIILPKIYHSSSCKNRHSILKKGLLPKVGVSYGMIHGLDSKPAIFAKNIPDLTLSWGCDDYDVWEIDTTKLKNTWELDPFFKNPDYIMTFKHIHRKYLKLVYRGTE